MTPLLSELLLVLASILALSWLTPWLSMRGLTLTTALFAESYENETASLRLCLTNRHWWPAVLVQVKICWRWAERETQNSHWITFLRAHQSLELGPLQKFPCRGHYQLTSVQLGCSFPLGLFHVRRHLIIDKGYHTILPRRVVIELPLIGHTAEDPETEQVSQRLGHSTEQGMLRPYLHGDPIRHVHWRASARTGQLIVKQFHQTGAPTMQLLTDLPDHQQIGLTHAPCEVAVRVAASIYREARAAGIHVRTHSKPYGEEIAKEMTEDWAQDKNYVHQLACTEAVDDALSKALADASSHHMDDELWVMVVAHNRSAADVEQLLGRAHLQTGQLLIYVAMREEDAAQEQNLGLPLVEQLTQLGYEARPCLA